MMVLSGATTVFSSMDKQRAEKKAIVLAVFGTTYPKALQSILNLQEKMQRAFPGMPVKMAFTSEIVRAKWATRAKDDQWRAEHPEIPDFLYRIRNPLATIAILQDEGYRQIAVQSTHIFAGEEYENLKSEIEALNSIETLRKRDKPFKKIILGRPALGASGDVRPYRVDLAAAAEIIKQDVVQARNNRSVLVYMGHGNEIFSTGAYVEFEAVLRDANPDLPIFIGNVEGFPEPRRVLKELQHADIKRITLFPLMVVAGDHAANDMAGDEADSWKNMFEKAGIEVMPVLRGLGELDGWADLYVRHLKEAMSDYGF
ncbi:MAG: sirohydrochlorin cobaltochelatase [Desulfatitalea sp.]|nr:sirohydrochlorin cobaltochelatase [Desulfatitalea sp.]NNK00285.1 sirohydrochlorin cobaltochelatase [Desulfatitalea sp.]